MSITHVVYGRKFTIETYWLKERGKGAFCLIYSINGTKVTKEEFMTALCDAVEAHKYDDDHLDNEVHDRGTKGS